MTYFHTSWVIRILAIAAAPEALACEHVCVAPALARTICFEAENFFTHATFEPIDSRVHNAHVVGGAADVARANEGAAV